jgi:hypothetical protein
VRKAARVVGALGVIIASLTFLAPGASAVTLGKQRVLTVLVAFGPQPYSRAVVSEAISGADAFLRRSSYGKVSLQPTITPWLSSEALAEPDCGLSTERVLAPLRALANAAGFRTAEFDHTIYVVDGVRCGFQGIAAGSDILLTRQPDPLIIVHELGHTFGLPHSASSSSCSTWCVMQEAGDLYSVMGRGMNDFSVYEKEQLGWVPRQPRVVRPGNYTVLPVSEKSIARQALVVDSSEGEYWLEQRPGLAKPALIVRVVHPDDGPSWAIAPSTLLLAPIRAGHPTIAAGQTFHVDGAFTVTVAKTPAPLRLRLTLAAGYH